MKKNSKLNTFDYIYFVLSFVPFIGIVFAIISLFIGIQKKSWLLELVFIFSLIITLYSGNSFVKYISNISNDTDSWLVFNENDLNKTLSYLENYKMDNDVYPDSLGSLKKYDAFMNFTEIPNGNAFYYEKTSDWTAPKSLDRLNIKYYKNEFDIVSDSFYLSSILFYRYCNSKCIVLFHFSTVRLN